VSLPSAFLESVIAFLLPYVATAAKDMRDARNEIIELLGSYGTRTRSEMLQAAQIIAFSMTTLDVLAEAKTAEMSQSMRLRYRSCANGLNRSTMRTEKVLDERLAYDPPPAIPDTVPEPVNDVPDADLEIAMEHARAAIKEHRDHVAATSRSRTGNSHNGNAHNGNPHAASPHPGHPTNGNNNPPWAGPMIDTLQKAPVAPSPGA
jgi:hypothetical protein